MNVRSCVKSIVYRTNALLCRDEGPKIIYYHDVEGLERTPMCTPFDLFQRQVDVARSLGYRFVEMPPEGGKCLMVCFDDGFRGIWDRRDYFVRERIFPTVSIAVDLVGRPGYLTWPEILELRSSGFRFSSHTWSHRSLTEVPDEELPHELHGSREALSEKLNEPIDAVCFPRGKFSGAVLEAVERAGYAIGYASVPGLTTSPLAECGSGVRVLPRLLVQDASPMRFADILRGAMLPLRGYYLRRHFE